MSTIEQIIEYVPFADRGDTIREQEPAGDEAAKQAADTLMADFGDWIMGVLSGRDTPGDKKRKVQALVAEFAAKAEAAGMKAEAFRDYLTGLDAMKAETEADRMLGDHAAACPAGTRRRIVEALAAGKREAAEAAVNDLASLRRASGGNGGIVRDPHEFAKKFSRGGGIVRPQSKSQHVVETQRAAASAAGGIVRDPKEFARKFRR